MATEATITKITIFEDTPATLVARLRLVDTGAYITQAAISSITRRVYDCTMGTPTKVGDDATITINTSVYNTLQTGTLWTDAQGKVDADDSTGYNFKDTVPATVFSDGDKLYKVEYTFVTSGQPLIKVFQVATILVLGS